MKPIIKYPMGDVKNQPVINIAGRDYVVMPYIADAHIPAEFTDFVKRHPERDDVNHMLQHAAERIVQDVMNYLRDAVAVTVVKSEDQADEAVMTDYDILLPVLMPLDTKERWNGSPIETEYRIRKAYDEHQQSGKPYIFKIGERENPALSSEQEALLNQRVEELDLSVRTRNLCKANGINTIRDICRLQKTDWLKFRNSGKKSLLELDDFLAKHGLAWGML